MVDYNKEQACKTRHIQAPVKKGNKILSLLVGKMGLRPLCVTPWLKKREKRGEILFITCPKLSAPPVVTPP